MLFFPLRDVNPVRRVPFFNYALIVINVAAFLSITARESQGEFWLTAWYGLVPSRLLSDPQGEVVTVVTSMFLHGGWMHLASNMWFLHIFGDNLEDMLGRVRYLLFYGICGVFAAAAQIWVDTSSSIPMVGASGAIAGVVGGYVVLCPRAPILSFNTVPLLWLFLGLLVTVPAWVIALLFFGQNLLLAAVSAQDMSQTGVAFFAHLGGFVAGLVLIKPFAGDRKPPRQVWQTFHYGSR
jgi:membrane associated rhomboid family serine protease